MSERLTIPARFCGPPSSGNGGYVAGRLAALVGGEAEVTIRRPVPVDRALLLHRVDDRVELRDGDAVLASATPARVDVEPPTPVDLEQARIASSAFPRFHDHPLPGCFACGTARDDGLRIFPGPVRGRNGLWAAPWTPSVDLAAAAGVVPPEITWAALDCIGAFAMNEPPRGLALLGRIAARIVAPVRAGDPHVVAAWPLAVDGRKLQPGTAIFSRTGALRAIARATWILTT